MRLPIKFYFYLNLHQTSKFIDVSQKKADKNVQWISHPTNNSTVRFGTDSNALISRTLVVDFFLPIISQSLFE